MPGPVQGHTPAGNRPNRILHCLCLSRAHTSAAQQRHVPHAAAATKQQAGKATGSDACAVAEAEVGQGGQADQAVEAPVC
jgi:hypothetical protein